MASALEQLVAWRCRVLALPCTATKAFLIHRDTLHRAGGMRPLPLMEDVDLIRRLGRDRLVGLNAAAVTSAAKWERDGWYRRSCRNLMCSSTMASGDAAGTDRPDLQMKDTVVVFARAPRLGTVKRRLARDIGDRAALRFHTSTLIRLLQRPGAGPDVSHRAGDDA